MALPIRFESEFQNSQGQYFTVRILDTDHPAGSSPLKFLASEFEVRYLGDNAARSRFTSIIPSQATVNLVIEETDTTIRAFINDLIDKQEERYYLEILYGKQSITPKVLWRGKIVQDLVKEEDRPYPHSFQLKASCGLNSLKALTYEELGTDTRNLLTDLIKILKEALNFEIWEDTDLFVRTTVEWYETQMAGITVNPIQYSKVLPAGVFYRTDLQDEIEYKDLYKCLEIICKAWGVRVFQAQGYWNFVQIGQYKNDAVQVYDYTYEYAMFNDDPDDDNQAGATIIQTNVRVDTEQEPDFCLTGGEYSWLPALKEVRSRFSVDEWLFLGRFRFTQDDVNVFETVGDVKLFGTAAIRFGLSYGFKFQGASGSANNLTATFTIKLGIYYLDSNYDWVTTPSTITKTYLGSGGPQTSYVITGGGLDSFVASAHPVGGDLEVKVVYSPTCTGSFPTLPGNPDEECSFLVSAAYVVPDELNYIDFVAENTTNPESSEIIDLGDIVLGDFPDSSGKHALDVWDGAAWQEADGWQIEALGTTYQFGQLLTLDYLRGQVTPIRKYSGSFMGLIHFNELVLKDSSRMMFMNGTFSSRFTQWEVELVETQYVTSGINTKDPSFGIGVSDSNGVSKIVNTTTGGSFGIGSLKTAISSGATTTSLTLNSLGEDLPDGWKITLLNNNSGDTQTFTTDGETAAGTDVVVNVVSQVAASTFDADSNLIFDGNDQIANTQASSAGAFDLDITGGDHTSVMASRINIILLLTSTTYTLPLLSGVTDRGEYLVNIVNDSGGVVELTCSGSDVISAPNLEETTTTIEMYDKDSVTFYLAASKYHAI